MVGWRRPDAAAMRKLYYVYLSRAGQTAVLAWLPHRKASVGLTHKNMGQTGKFRQSMG